MQSPEEEAETEAENERDRDERDKEEGLRNGRFEKCNQYREYKLL